MRMMITLSAVLFLVAVTAPFSAGQAPEPMEETGIDLPAATQAHFQVDSETLNRRLQATGFLLIPDSISDTVGMFDPVDGTYLGDLIDGTGMFSTPVNAVLAPDGDIYVSDQVADSVFVFDVTGNFLYTYADSTDGLNNIRGIDFFGGHLFVTSGDDYVAEFDAPHSRLTDFINDGSDPFDILFLSDGTSLLCDIASDTMRYYDAGGTLSSTLFGIDFAEQVQFDSVTPGDYLVCAFTAAVIQDFEINGTIVETTQLSSSGRGVFRLGNGNILTTNGSGVFEITPGTGAIVEQEYAGSSRFIELVAPGSSDPLVADTNQLSVGGGVINFTLDAGAANAGRPYYLVGSVNGTTPGTLLPGGLATIPINRDWFTNFILGHILYPQFSGFLGTLDANGGSAATLDTMGPLPGALPVGTVMHFAFALSTPWDYASNAVAVDVVP